MLPDDDLDATPAPLFYSSGAGSLTRLASTLEPALIVHRLDIAQINSDFCEDSLASLRPGLASCGGPVSRRRDLPVPSTVF